MKPIDEWNNLVANMDYIYIFGAEKVAKKLYDLLVYSNKVDCLKGFIVTSMDNNPSEINGISVFLLTEIVDKYAVVLMSLSETYHHEMFQKLKELGFENIVSAHKYFSIDLKKSNDEPFDNITKYIVSDIKLPHKLEAYRGNLIKRYYEYSHAFGGGGFYQSLPSLGIQGTRDTALRIKKYGLMNYIHKGTTVLDIGCNIGFLDMEISKHVKSIVGIEYSEILVDLARETSRMVGINNIDFISGDYTDWEKTNTKQFDVIFSFAVHGWINVEPEEYAKQIIPMLNDNGIFIIESQQLSTDKMFSSFVKSFLNNGLQAINENMINDDGETDRQFVVLQKK